MTSEAAYRFSRGVHPTLAKDGVLRGLALMQRWSGGVVAQGLVDSYPLPPDDPMVEFNITDVERWLGIKISSEQIKEILTKLDFTVRVDGDNISAQTPAHRLDIGQGIIGVADLMEEIARIYGYDRIPETRLSDTLPPQRGNPALELEDTLRDTLVNLGLQEVISHRLTNPENESQIFPAEINSEVDYVRIANPIASDRIVLRQSLLSSILNAGERNSRISNSLALFELGEVFLPEGGKILPKEPRKLAIYLCGTRSLPQWQASDQSPMDFYDMKGIIAGLFDGLHLIDIQYEPNDHPSFHPGKCASLKHNGQKIGVFGEIHPQVKENYDFQEFPVLAAELDVDAMAPLIPDRYYVNSIPIFPPVLEDLAIVVEEKIDVQDVLDITQSAGGETVTDISLFDVYRGGQAGPGKKSLAFRIKYQNPDRTLTDKEVARIRNKIIKQLEEKIGAQLRS
jgi:phenylalanyl-tRNA synthetase beta chain